MSVDVPMAIGAAGGVAITQRAVPLAPLDGFDMAVHERGVDQLVMTRNRQTGVVAPLVVGILDRRVDELVLRDRFAHADPFGGVQDAQGVRCALLRVREEGCPRRRRVLSDLADGACSGEVAPRHDNALVAVAAVIGDGWALEGLHGLVPDAADLAGGIATAFNVGGDVVVPIGSARRIAGVHTPARDVLVVLRVLQEAEAELFHVGRAGNGVCLFTCLRQRGEQHGGQNRDDRDDDQKLDQCELQHFLHG